MPATLNFLCFLNLSEIEDHHLGKYLQKSGCCKLSLCCVKISSSADLSRSSG